MYQSIQIAKNSGLQLIQHKMQLNGISYTTASPAMTHQNAWNRRLIGHSLEFKLKSTCTNYTRQSLLLKLLFYCIKKRATSSRPLNKNRSPWGEVQKVKMDGPITLFILRGNSQSHFLSVHYFKKMSHTTSSQIKINHGIVTSY